MSLPPQTICPLCRATGAQDVGQIHHYRPHKVAGVDIDLSGFDFHLRRCPTCKFQFKDPPIPEEKLLDCYARANEACWGVNPDPHERYFDYFKRVAETHAPGRRVLDIGCFNGALLQHLGSEWKTFGVEPSERAANLAQERGVSILGPTLREIPADFPAFDAIFAIDVLEHIVDPMPFFQRVHDLLSPRGIFVGLTGDTGSLAWRLNGSRYWYCSLPEHVSFYSEPTMDFIAQRLGMKNIEHQHMSHHRTRLSRKIPEITRNGLFILGTHARWFGMRGLQKRMDRSSPMWFASGDHMLHVMQRQ